MAPWGCRNGWRATFRECHNGANTDPSRIVARAMAPLRAEWSLIARERLRDEAQPPAFVEVERYRPDMLGEYDFRNVVKHFAEKYGEIGGVQARRESKEFQVLTLGAQTVYHLLVSSRRLSDGLGAKLAGEVRAFLLSVPSVLRAGLGLNDVSAKVGKRVRSWAEPEPEVGRKRARLGEEEEQLRKIRCVCGWAALMPGRCSLATVTATRRRISAARSISTAHHIHATPIPHIVVMPCILHARASPARLDLDSSGSDQLGELCAACQHVPSCATTPPLTLQLHVLLDNTSLDVVVAVLGDNSNVAVNLPAGRLGPRGHLGVLEAEPACELAQADTAERRGDRRREQRAERVDNVAVLGEVVGVGAENWGVSG